MNACIALAIAYTGFVTLGLAMERHQIQMLERALPPRWTLPLRSAGSALLIASLWVCLREGSGSGSGSVSLGILWWLGLLSIAGLALGLLLAYRPRWARLAGVVAAAIAAAGSIAQDWP